MAAAATTSTTAAKALKKQLQKQNINSFVSKPTAVAAVKALKKLYQQLNLQQHINSIFSNSINNYKASSGQQRQDL